MGCPSGKYTSTPGNLVCDICASGSYSFQSELDEGSFVGPTACTTCSVGTFVAAPGAAACANCPTGKYNENTGRTSCYGRCSEACPEGKFREGCQATSKGQCTTCPVGKFTIPFNQGCIDKSACVPGQYRDSKADTCELCPDGKFKTDFSSDFCSSCQSCPAGKFRQGCGSNSGGTCEPCALGMFKSDVGVWSAVCDKCSAGTHASGTGSSECINCQAGQYATTEGMSDCDICTKGTIAATQKATGCTTCVLGTVAPNDGSSACDKCQQGYFSTDNKEVCKACVRGQYQAYEAKTSCDNCGAGYFSEVEHSGSMLNCEHCPAGKWSAVSTGECNLCDSGKFMDGTKTGMTHEGHCVVCAAGKFQHADGSTTCDHCPSGKWQKDTASTVCDTCVRVDSLRYDWTQNEGGWTTPCVPHPLNCQHSAWTQVTSCSKSCTVPGTPVGTFRETRTVTEQEWGGGDSCASMPLERFIDCNSHPCPVDCVMQEYGGWSDCTVPCGGGTQFRTRGIASDPRFGGQVCGKLRDEMACNTNKCTLNECSHVHCDYTPYTQTRADRTHSAAFPNFYHAHHGEQTSVGKMRIRVTHDRHELHGDRHVCNFNKSLGRCQCICSHVEPEFQLLLADRNAAMTMMQNNGQASEQKMLDQPDYVPRG